MDLKKVLLEKRPTLSESSLKTYDSCLRSLWKKVYDKPMEWDEFNSPTMYEFVKEHANKTTLSALCVLTDNPAYREILLKSMKKHTAEMAKQEKSEKQEKNWLTKEEIQKEFDRMAKLVPSWYKQEKWQDIQQYILLALLGGIFIEPRRSKDYFDFKIKNIDKEKDNYLDKKSLVFNSYKTAKFYGRQVIEVPKALLTILRKWIKNNPTDYLLYDSKMKPLTAVTINQRFEKMFGKQASVNLLRHTHLSDKFSDVPMQQITDTFRNMGSSVAQFNTYVKI
jgi:integrase